MPQAGWPGVVHPALGVTDVQRRSLLLLASWLPAHFLSKPSPFHPCYAQGSC